MTLKKVWVKPIISLLFCLLLLISGFSLVKQINQIFFSPKLSFDTFDGAKLCHLGQSKQAPLSINPEHTPAFKPESRRIDKILQIDFKENKPFGREVVTVKRVIDGDTIELKDNRRVRYIGINAPEVDYSTPGVEGPKPQGLKDCFGKEAKEINKELIEGKMVELEKDVSETDKYGRYLRYVYVDGIFINDWLVENGFAKMMTIPPDVRFAKTFKEKERLAREEKRGLWGECY